MAAESDSLSQGRRGQGFWQGPALCPCQAPCLLALCPYWLRWIESQDQVTDCQCVMECRCQGSLLVLRLHSNCLKHSAINLLSTQLTEAFSAKILHSTNSIQLKMCGQCHEAMYQHCHYCQECFGGYPQRCSLSLKALCNCSVHLSILAFHQQAVLQVMCKAGAMQATLQ